MTTVTENKPNFTQVISIEPNEMSDFCRRFELAKINLSVLMYLATAIAVKHLANSAGCKLIGPNVSHDSEPLISRAKIGVIISSTIITA